MCMSAAASRRDPAAATSTSSDRENSTDEPSSRAAGRTVAALLEDEPEVFEQRARACFESRLVDFDRIVIHGANRLGTQISSGLRKLGIKPVGFVDAVRGKWGRSLSGLAIRSIAEARGEFGPESSCVLAWHPPPLGLRRTRLRSHSASLAELREAEMSTLHWRCAAIVLGTNFRGDHGSAQPAQIHGQAEAILEAQAVLADAGSRRAFARALEQRLSGFVSPAGDTMDSLIDPVGDPGGPALELGIEPDLSSGQCAIVDLGAGQGHALQEFVARSGNRLAGAFVAETNRAREARLREVVDDLRKEQGADIELWNSVDRGPVAKGGAGLLEALQAWTRKLQASVSDPRMHLLLDVSGGELDCCRALAPWIAEHRPRMCISATAGAARLWEIPLCLHRAEPKLAIRLACDGVDPEFVIVRAD